MRFRNLADFVCEIDSAEVIVGFLLEGFIIFHNFAIFVEIVEIELKNTTENFLQFWLKFFGIIEGVLTTLRMRDFPSKATPPFTSRALVKLGNFLHAPTQT